MSITTHASAFDPDDGVAAGPRVAALEALTRQFLETLGEDPSRSGLARTPGRVARAWEFLTDGYRAKLGDIVGGALFDESYDEMVIVRDIDYFSMCEHHLLPFYGKCHVAYIPMGRIVGLSKIPRIVEMFARRLQVQERMTRQIAEALDGLIAPEGVGVVCEGRHMCMMMRGVEQQHAVATTSAMLGAFRDDEKTRAEFLSLIARKV
jgi:GTP cyclohydrolase I